MKSGFINSIDSLYSDAAVNELSSCAKLQWRQEYRHLISLVRLWHARVRQRHQSARLPDSALKDIGVSRVEALSEASKPFWRS